MSLDSAPLAPGGPLMFCAVLDCENTATEPFIIGGALSRAHEQAVAMVCTNHDFTQPGWRLRTGIATPPTLYPPDTTLPPF